MTGTPMPDNAEPPPENSVGQRAIAFLDLLGFRDLVTSDAELSLELLKNYSASVRDYLDAWSEDRASSSIDFFVPMSDSLVIVSNDCDELVRFVARLVCECYRYTSHVQNAPQEWPITLFRGAIAYGSCLPVKQTAIYKKQRTAVWNFVGAAFVDAVKAEPSGKGPRVFCTAEVAARLAGDHPLIARQGSSVEVLWPAVAIYGDTPNADIGKLFSFLDDAVRLLRIYAATRCRDHYIEFVRLVVRSVCARAPFDPPTVARLREKVSSAGIAALVADLLP